MLSNEWIMMLGYLVVLVGVFYLFVLMPRKQQEKRHQNMLEELQKGDKVTTIGGIKGEIAKIKDDTVLLKINDTVQMEMLKKAIAYKAGEEPK
ncbi:preprotein translocase subunit yajc [hydrocarbon metagenome]|uniref:Preprotein translocase subunit yajc n=1 Tax=hydrocarbon metagenome TaxID=938273 RepID=A0A0W8E688_9ZZZZ